MGSIGSGNFTDYQGFSGKNPKQGGESNQNDCGKAFRTDLEDVELSQYFNQYAALPPVNSDVVISFDGTRIIASLNGLGIGNLPTKYNYLYGCLKDFNYQGIISSTSRVPISSITINISPNE